MLKVKRTGAAEYGRYMKLLICGEPGAGKTLISSTLPHPIYASAEGGLMSVADRDIPYVDITSSDELLALKVSLDQSPDVRAKMFGFPIETVVLDTIDEIQRILIRERLEENKKDAMQLQDWGWLGEQMQAIIRGFRNLDMNVILLCHIKETTDGETGNVSFKPQMQGAIVDQLPAFVDLSLLLKAELKTVIRGNETQKELVRTLHTVPTNKFPWIKDRSGKLPQEIPVNFVDDFARIQKMIFGDVGDLPASKETTVETPLVPSAEQPTQVAAPPVQEKPKPSASAAKKAAPKAAAPATPVAESSPPPGVDPETGEITAIEAQATLTPVEEKPAETVQAPSSGPTCTDCGSTDLTQDQADLSRIRHRRILCKPCFQNAKAKK